MIRARCPQTRLFALLAALALLGPIERASAAAAADSAAEQSLDPWVDQGQQALRQGGASPWYDPVADQIRVIRLPERSKKPDWTLPKFLQEALTYILWGGLVVVLAVLLFLLYRAIRYATIGAAPASGDGKIPLGTVEQVEALSFLQNRPRGDLLAEARRHYEQGNYDEAIIYLFSYELVRLDQSALIRLTRGKTNRQYLREAAKVEPLKKLLASTMLAFEDVFFGRIPLGRDRFESCWTRLNEFEQLVTGASS